MSLMEYIEGRTSSQLNNPEKELFEVEAERNEETFFFPPPSEVTISEINLNKVLKFDYPEITKEAAQAYLKKG
jgi:hypothetical protein